VHALPERPVTRATGCPSTHVDKQEFLRRADQCLERVAQWLEAFDPDEVDFATSDGVVTLEFGDGGRFVLNRQAAASQMWFAAGARAWHYDFDAAHETWVDDRDGHDLFENVAACVSEKIGRTVAI
jgi:CyaY protein